MAQADAVPSDDFDYFSKIKKLLPQYLNEGKIQDWQGHFLQGSLFYHEGWSSSAEKRLARYIGSWALWASVGVDQKGPVAQQLSEAMEAGVPLSEPVVLRGGYEHLECPYCGVRLHLAFDGQNFTIGSEPCAFPDGIVTEFELNVSSGKIVVDDDLRRWFPVEDDRDVNAVVGKHYASLDAASKGFAYGFVGNSCPGVWRAGENRFAIGNWYAETWDKKSGKDIPNPDPCPWGEQVASVCTDLWWYSIADYDELEKRIKHYTPDTSIKEVTDHWTVNVVDVKPGVYRFRHIQDINYEGPITEYATFEWVRDPDPIRDYLKEEREQSSSATEVLIQKCISWPDLYMGVGAYDLSEEEATVAWESLSDEEKAHALARAADQTMCVLGGGVKWHENGFPRGTISEKAKRLAKEYGAVPSFDFETRWYPISSGYGGLCCGAGIIHEDEEGEPMIRLAPDFVQLGLNICQNAIKYGEKPRLNTDVYPPAYEIPFARDRMRRFILCYKGLRKNYEGEPFDKAFDEWMNETDLEAHVLEFDFGPKHSPKEKWGDPPVTLKKGEYFEFDSSKLDSGYFCWAQGAWAKKEDAERYAIGVLCGTQSKMGHLHVEASARSPSMIPLKAVGRVLRGTGEGHASAHLVVTFDYGTENMRGEMAFDKKDMDAVEQFSDEKRYADLLEEHKIAFAKLGHVEKHEKPMKAKKRAKKRKKR